MCGIAGFVSSNPRYDKKDIVSRMLEKMSYRGPDQTGVAEYGDCALGMLRLSIIDKVRHEIPIESPDGTAAIVYNGEIYNAEELRAPLARDYAFKTASDSEVALAAYLDGGVKALGEFNGMYAFAVHDKRSGETVIVRDKAGEKPLYYAQGKDFFAFASEMKALLVVVEPCFNEEALSYRAYEFTCGSETLFKDIHCLEPGSYISFKDGRLRKSTYWTIWDNLIPVPDDYRKLKLEFTDLLHDAVRLRVRNCCHNLGVMVSGGLDSAIVACITKPDYLFTCHYDLGEEFNELEYAKMVAKHVDRELIIIEPQPEDFIRTQHKIAFHLDSPCTWTSFSWWMILERLSKYVKVVLTGDGADETFGGYYRYMLLYNDEQLRQMQTMKQYTYLMDKYYGSPVSRYARLVNRCERKSDQAVADYLDETIGFYFSKMNGDVIHSMGITDFYTTMQVLLQMADRMTAAFSIENRSPFLDHRLLQFAFSMNSKYKINQGVTKFLLKDVARDIIPKPIVERVDKRGFSAPVNKWFNLEQYGKYDRSIYRNWALKNWWKVFMKGKAPPQFNKSLLSEAN